MSDKEKLAINRRELLRTIGAGAVVGVGGAGVAGATPTGRHVVGTKNNRGLEKARQVASDVHRELDFGDVGQAVAGRFPEQARKALEKNPNIRYIEPDGRMEAIDQSLPWGVDRTDSDLTQDDGYTGEGADIAIIDSGIDSDHPDLQANLGSGKAFAYCSGCAESWDDDNDHGTHCAGIAAAVDNSEAVVGVAPSATLHAVKVLTSNGWGSYSDIAAGIQYVGDRGWDVASMSLGGSSYSYSVADAVEYATSQGVLCVAAAGNSGPCSDCVLFPATHPDVMAVSATDSSDGLAYFSSTGSEIDIAAPGYSILSTVSGGGTAYFSGTSMACPHVAGAAGVLMASGYSNTEARARLERNAEDIGLSGNEQGNGLLDVEAAMGGGGNDDTTAPSTPTNVSSPSQTGSSVDLTWDASSDDAGVDHYNVFQDGTKETEASGTSVTVSGLQSETSYDFAVSAVDGAGNESGQSDALSVTTTAPLGDHTIEIEGTGVRADYEFEVEGDLAEAENITSEDSIDGNVATGAVRGGSDVYSYSGEVLRFTVDAEINLYIDGEPVEPETIGQGHTIEIEGTGVRADYEFEVESDLAEEKNITSEDSIDGNVATGAVRGGSDVYSYSGEVLRFSVDAEVNLYIDGEPVDPSTIDQSHTIEIEGTGVRADYEYEFESDLAEEKNITSEDSIDGNVATGAVRGGSDVYSYSGEVLRFSVDAEVNLYIDGQPVDPDSV